MALMFPEIASHILGAGTPQISYDKIARDTRSRHVHRCNFKTSLGGKRQDSSVDVTATLHEHQTKRGGPIHSAALKQRHR